jgi:uncharacterized membrane protein
VAIKRTRVIPVEMSRRAEARWPAFASLIVMLVLYALTPAEFVPRLVLIGIAVLMFIPLIVLNPHRLSRETSWSRWLSISLGLVLVAGNLVDMGSLIFDLVSGSTLGYRILLTALQVWVANIVAFAIVYWEMDRGGPVSRGTQPRDKLGRPDFKFVQDDDADSVTEVRNQSSELADWRPGFIDYLYLSLTNMTAFSPTDTMPLTSRAKMLMGLQSLCGFILLALVIARSVNILA